jgi:hypothetical protein
MLEAPRGWEHGDRHLLKAICESAARRHLQRPRLLAGRPFHFLELLVHHQASHFLQGFKPKHHPVKFTFIHPGFSTNPRAFSQSIPARALWQIL